MNSPETMLVRECDAGARLLDILCEEHRALTNRDIETLGRIVHEKKQQVIELESLARERDAILRELGFTVGREGIESWLHQRSNGAALGLWKELQDLLLRGRQQNRINGGLVEINRRCTQRALGLLQGQPPEQEIYGPTGVSSAAVRSSIHTSI